MKSFNYKALAVAAASACGASAAFAGSVTVPAGASVIKFAREAVTNTTSVTIPTLTYTMGVARAANQNFTFIVKVPGAGTAFSGTCPTGSNINAGAANFALALKRQSTNECAYDVTVANGSAVNQVITINNLTVTNHALGDGTNLSLVVNLADPGETSRVDNSADLTATIATSTTIVSLSATADNHTTADVNYNSGNSPLFGFVANTTGGTSAVNDTSTNTYANFSVNVASGYVVADGATPANAANALANVTLNVSGDFSGLITNFANGNSTISYAGATSGNATVNYTSGAAVFTLANTDLTATGATNVQVKLTTAATASLGTSRTFTVSGTDRGIAGGSFTLAANGWWTWKANAIQLQSAFFNNDTASGSLTRFFFQNLGTAANYSATCYGETGVTPTNGTAATGTLAAGTTAINASDICTFSTGKRGSIVFTINSAASKIKGVYQQAINGSAATYIPLERPYSAGTY